MKIKGSGGKIQNRGNFIMKNGKKLALIVPLSCAIVTGIGTNFVKTDVVHADSKVESQKPQISPAIKGFMIKNGMQTPVYANQKANESEIPYPVLSNNPSQEAPDKGASSDLSGDFGNIIYMKGSNGKYYYITANYTYNNVDAGQYDPKTLELYGAYYHTAVSGLNVAQLFDGLKLYKKTYYNLLNTNLLDDSASYSYTDSISSGMSDTTLWSLALSVGAKLTLKEGGGIFPAESTQELSTQLTSTFGQNSTVTKQTSKSQNFGLPAVNSSDYAQKYSNYRAAVYQIHSEYSVEFNPSGLLKSTIETIESEENTKLTFAGTNETLKDDSATEFYVTRTPGSWVVK
ncbi:hypothetical protein [Bacillus cereus]|uniref:hypothetical protein n=1 Tax=Bacillus cereus TaxID=1396 RepID=UPI000994CC1F|nr:hypothetical protein [Bacillus cereus]OPA10898.1 hypothetical protein BHL54_21145 [Bacillus cereus]